MLKLATQVF